MRDLRISELIPNSPPKPQDLVPLADGIFTKRVELSSVWSACLDGTLNPGNTAIFLQNVQVSGNFISIQGEFEELLKVPAGTIFERVSALGAIRYNTTDEYFEGFNGVSWGQIGGNVLRDGDNDTKIEVDTVPFSDVDQIKFTTNGTLRTVILSTGEMGIGTPSPIKPLTVVGDISASGRVYGLNFYPQRRFEYVPSIITPVSYSATAPFGYAESDGIWEITRIVYTATGTVSSVETRPNVAWADRMFVF